MIYLSLGFFLLWFFSFQPRLLFILIAGLIVAVDCRVWLVLADVCVRFGRNSVSFGMIPLWFMKRSNWESLVPEFGWLFDKLRVVDSRHWFIDEPWKRRRESGVWCQRHLCAALSGHRSRVGLEKRFGWMEWLELLVMISKASWRYQRWFSLHRPEKVGGEGSRARHLVQYTTGHKRVNVSIERRVSIKEKIENGPHQSGWKIPAGIDRVVKTEAKWVIETRWEFGRTMAEFPRSDWTVSVNEYWHSSQSRLQTRSQLLVKSQRIDFKLLRRFHRW